MNILSPSPYVSPGCDLVSSLPTSRPIGFRMPAESSPHGRTWMQWPARVDLYSDVWTLSEIRVDVARLARAIARFEPVVMMASPDQAESARNFCGPAVKVLPVPLDDLWARDTAPTFLVNAHDEVVVIDFHFNGWGAKQSCAFDAALIGALARQAGMTRLSADLVCEGGAFEVDGEGTVITTESVLCNSNRNPGRTRQSLEASLNEALGTRKVIWLPGVKGRDITDGHIDGFLRFVRPGLVLVELGPEGDKSPEAVMARNAVDILGRSLDAQGRKLRVVTLQRPTRCRSTHPDFLMSYANYYVCNGAVVMAEFGDSQADARAADMLGALYPGREVVAVNVDHLHENGGGIHCATQQQPVGKTYALF